MRYQVTLLALLAVFCYTMAIQCYKCEGLDDDGGCGDLFVASSSKVDIVTCTEHAVGCKKEEIHLGSLGWEVERACEYSISATRCDKITIGVEIRDCYCQTNLCNNAPTFQLMSRVATSAISLVLTKLLL